MSTSFKRTQAPEGGARFPIDARIDGRTFVKFTSTSAPEAKCPRTNTGVKDLIDLVLLIDRETLEGDRVLGAVQATFDRRRTHDIPPELPAPPADWEKSFAVLARECELAYTPRTAHAHVNEFWQGLNPESTSIDQ